eukprot:5475705-Lingulodinium_polyedra.AAC.1
MAVQEARACAFPVCGWVAPALPARFQPRLSSGMLLPERCCCVAYVGARPCNGAALQFARVVVFLVCSACLLIGRVASRLFHVSGNPGARRADVIAFCPVCK